MNTALSAVIITHNAETQLDTCLASLKLADEILIFDSGSEDDTETISGNTVRVFSIRIG